MNTRTVTPSETQFPLDRYPHIEFSVTVAVVTEKKCLMCGKEISNRRTTCSANCRKAASRRKEQLARELRNVQDALRTLERYSSMWLDIAPAIEKTLNECVTAATVTYFSVTSSGITE